MHYLNFTQARTYPNDENGVALPVTLRSGEHWVQVVASVDTDATFCVFSTEVANSLALDLRSQALSPTHQPAAPRDQNLHTQIRRADSGTPTDLRSPLCDQFFGRRTRACARKPKDSAASP